MKRITFLLTAAFLISGLNAYSQKVEPGSVVGITQVKPAPEVSNNQFEKYYQEELIPAFNKAFSLPISLMKTIEGKRMDEYAEFYVFETLKERNRWFPKPGVSSEEAKKAFKNMGDAWSKIREMITSLEYTDYLVLPMSVKNIDVKPGNVVCVFECDFMLEDGMTYEDLEQLYLNEYGPAIMKNFPGTQFCVLKGDRGDRTGKYTEFMILGSLEEYNSWFTEDGKFNEKAKLAFDNMQEIQDRMAKMYSYSTSTYYIVL